MMKAIAILIGVSMLFSSFFAGLNLTVEGKDIAPAPLFSGQGSGTVADPFRITNVNQLQEMSLNLGANYTLMNDIDASATTGWNAGAGFAPIGDASTPFAGHLEGNGFVIDFLYIDRSTEDDVSLMGYMDSGSYVGNLTLENLDFTGDNRAGAIAGMLYEGTVYGCSATGIVDADSNTGGLVGFVYLAEIRYCVSMVRVNAGSQNNGGLVGGSQSAAIINCHSSGDVNGGFFVGGLVGYHYPGSSITNSYSTGHVNASGTQVGGFVGRNEADISNSFSTGSVTTVQHSVGGFAGYNSANIMRCYSTGNARGDATVGGFIGDNAGSIQQSYALGDAYSWSNDAGGFAGKNGATISDCYARGSAYCWNVRAGGFVGDNSGGIIQRSYSIGTAYADMGTEGGFAAQNLATIDLCHWDNQASAQAFSDGGIGNTTAEMKLSETFKDWWAPGYWGIVEGETYPYLTVISPNVHSTQVCNMGSATEDVGYAVGFSTTIQPEPSHYAIEEWTLNTNAGWLSITPGGTVHGTPLNNDIGTYYAEVIATDIFGNEGVLNYSIVVENSDPTITNADKITTNTGALYEVDYDSTDDPSTTWSLAGNATGWLSIDNNGILSGTPSNAEAGIYNVEITVNDGNGGTDTRIFLLTVKLDTDGDGIPDDIDPDIDGDGVSNGEDAFPYDSTEWLDTDGDGIGNNADPDDDGDGWSDIIEIAGGFDPLDNSSFPGDEDGDGIADFMDPDFLTVIEYNNQTVWNNETVPEYHNSTVWNNQTVPEYHNTTVWNNATVPEYHNSTVWNNQTIPEYHNTTITNTETPVWAWGALIAAVVLGILAAITVMKGGNGPKQVSGPKQGSGPKEPEPETPVQEPQGEIPGP